MIKKEITITNSLGIHARPAVMIVKCASQFKSQITLQKDKDTADAKSIMSILMLTASYNSKISIKVNGEDEIKAIEALEALFKSNFNE